MPGDTRDELDRYSRQVLFEQVAVDGQRALLASRVVLVGCGALGSALADMLVRGGVGHLRICDRDHIELNNLQRQSLFDESDIERNLPKAIAAAGKLSRINSGVTIEPVVADVTCDNVERLTRGAALILDGTDNFETRYLLNDVAIKTGTPWIYGAVIGASGLVMPVLPGETACLRCVFENAPPPEISPTCDTAGVIAPAVNVVASLQMVEAMKLICGKRDAINRSLVSVDAWSGRLTHINTSKARRGDCICCGRRDFEYLDGRAASTAITLCGRDAVQISPNSREEDRGVDLSLIAKKLNAVTAEPVAVNEHMLRATVDRFIITVFPDGRTIVKGTTSAEEAKTVRAKYIGT